MGVESSSNAKLLVLEQQKDEALQLAEQFMHQAEQMATKQAKLEVE